MREPTAAARAFDGASGRDAADAEIGNLHPELIRVARTCYHTYLDDLKRTGQSDAERPIGIAVDRVSHRAKPIVGKRQPLLPQEHFVPLHLIDPNDLRSGQKR